MDDTRRRGSRSKIIKLHVKDEQANINSLGEDLLIEILSRLPVKYLLRCRSVSKTWYTLTTTDCFTSIHFSYHRLYRSDYRNHHPLFLTLIPTLEYSLESAQRISLLREEKEKTSLLRLPFDPVYGNHTKGWLMILGSSNGLVCLSVMANDEEKIVVWNPATEQYKCLPNCDSLFLDKIDDFNVQIDPPTGFDFVQNGDVSEYKVVRIFQDMSLHDKNLTFRAQVFVQNSNSWRLVTNKSDDHESDYISSDYISCDDSSITLNSVLYWKVHADLSVMSFDLRDEVFKKIQLPEQIQQQKLFSWKDSLACLDYDEDYDDNLDDNIVLWVMNSCNHVWTPQLKFKIHRGFAFSLYRPDLFLGSWKDKILFASLNINVRYFDYNSDEHAQFIDENGVDLLAYRRPKHVFSYDPKTQTGTEILEHEILDLYDCEDKCLVSYVESLAPV